MAQVPAWLGALSVALAIITGTAAAVAFYRSSYARTTIDTLKESNAAYVEHQGLQDAKIASLEAEVAHYRTTSATDRARVETLEKALQGKADFERLESLIIDHHREVMDDRVVDRQAASERHEALTKRVGVVEESVAQRLDALDSSLSQVKGMLGSRRREGSTARDDR